MKDALVIVVLIVAMAHLISGIAVLDTPAALNVSALSGIVRAVPTPDELNVAILGWALIAFGIVAIGAIVLPVKLPARLAMLIPQQIVVLTQLWSIGFTILMGSYPDGYTPAPGPCSILWNKGSCFILADQIATFMVGLTHTLLLIAVIARPIKYRNWHSPL